MLRMRRTDLSRLAAAAAPPSLASFLPSFLPYTTYYRSSLPELLTLPHTDLHGAYGRGGGLFVPFGKGGERRESAEECKCKKRLFSSTDRVFSAYN